MKVLSEDILAQVEFGGMIVLDSKHEQVSTLLEAHAHQKPVCIEYAGVLWRCWVTGVSVTCFENRDTYSFDIQGEKYSNENQPNN